MENISKSMQVEEKAGSLVRIHGLYGQFTGREKQVADYVLGNRDVIYQTITHVVKASGASYGSIDRFCKKLGYSGFQDLKISLAEDLAVRKISEEEEEGGDFIEKIAKAAKREIDNTVQLLNRETVNGAAKAILEASFILVAGLSSSAGTAMGIDYRLNRFGIRSACYIDNHLQRHRAASLGEGDLAFLISFSGGTKEILATGGIAKEGKARIISLTNGIESPVTELADFNLVTGIVNEPLRAEIASKAAVEFIITLLFERVAELMNHSRSMLIKTFNATADRQF